MTGSMKSSSTAIAVWLAETPQELRCGLGAAMTSRRSSRTSPKRVNNSRRVHLLDGEIVAIDENGRISFNLLQHHRSQAQALLFYAFDVLIHRGINLLNEPLSKRREVLSNIMKPLTRKASSIALSESIDATPAELIQVVKEFGFEGVIAKRKDSCYESGKRSGAWLKYKVNKSQEFVIGGYTPGNPLDALIVGYYDGDKLIYAGKVRNGFVPRLRRDVWQKLKGLEIASCPFANLPEKKRTQFSLTREEMKNCIWLKPRIGRADRVHRVDTGWTPAALEVRWIAG